MNQMKPTPHQENVLRALKSFAENPNQRVFILKGYAGTGKTTLMRFFMDYLKQEKKTTKLLATTGRAAKILANLTGRATSTIHSMIYAFDDLNKDLSSIKKSDLNMEATGQLFIQFEAKTLEFSEDEADKECIYIIDESSMISDTPDQNITQAKFGSGKLLTELLAFDPRPQSKFVFVGDPCQLPPVNGVQSPALDVQYFNKNYHITPTERALTEIIRQQNGNDLIPISKDIREMCDNAPEAEGFYGGRKNWGHLNMRYSNNVKLYYDVDEMIRHYIANIKKNGYNDSIFVCQSNRKCSDVSAKVRAGLGFRGDVQKGDLLMVIQNNLSGLMNGDMVEVVDVSNQIIRRAGLDFCTIKVKELFTKHEYNIFFMKSSLNSGGLNISAEQQTALFLDFVYRMKDKGIDQKRNKKQFKEMMSSDSFLNALRCSYGYAATCHKAQGGEWNNVYVDFGNMLLNPTKSKYQWIYTAVTRARKTLHILDKYYIR